MNFDSIQEMWQSQKVGDQITIDTDMLLSELRRNERSFRATVFWRDAREVIVAFVMAALFIRSGFRGDGWPFFAMAATCLWIGIYMLRDRLFWKQKVASYGESIFACIQSSLIQVEHQIHLLKTVLWWYILPPGIAVLIMLAWSAAQVDEWSWLVVVFLAIMIAICLGFFAFVYWLNQLAVRKALIPRREELKRVLDALTSESEEQEVD